MTQQLALDLTAAPRAPRRGKLRHYHAKAGVTIAEAQAGERAAKSQEARVLAWFRAQARGSRWAPSQVHAALVDELRCPIQSIRRAISNLTEERFLIQQEWHRHAGPWGRSEATWSLA